MPEPTKKDGKHDRTLPERFLITGILRMHTHKTPFRPPCRYQPQTILRTVAK